MNTTTLTFPAPRPFALPQPRRAVVVRAPAPVATDANDCRSVLSAEARAERRAERWERGLYALLTVASLATLFLATTTCGQWMTQRQQFVQWVEQILR